MTDELLTTLLPAMNVAVFRRADDGSFSPLAPSPPWFSGLADVTFPFLGHILEEATAFWRSGAPGWREYGPVAETDADGREFHYRVRALAAGDGNQFLMFELDRGSDRMRDTLQTAREQALVREQEQARQRRLLGQIEQRIAEMQQLFSHASSKAPGSLERGLIDALNAKCQAVRESVDSLTPRQHSASTDS